LEFEKQIQEQQKKYSKKIDEILERIRQWRWDDPVSAVYKELFKPEFIQELSISQDEIVKDLERRNKHSIPPGFKDKKKDDYGVGDLIIWKTILEVAKTRNRDIVFVSGDEKNDWFYRSDSQSLYPRFELITEFKNHTDDKTLHIIKLSKLLDLLGAAEEAVSEVQIKELEMDLDGDVFPLVLEGSQAEDAVFEWLRETEGDKLIVRSSRFPDFLIEDDDSREGVEVLSTANMSRFKVKDRIRERMKKARVVMKIKKMDRFRLVIVAPTYASVDNLRRRIIEDLDESETAIVQVVYGVVTDKGRFAKVV